MRACAAQGKGKKVLDVWKWLIITAGPTFFWGGFSDDKRPAARRKPILSAIMSPPNGNFSSSFGGFIHA